MKKSAIFLFIGLLLFISLVGNITCVNAAEGITINYNDNKIQQINLSFDIGFANESNFVTLKQGDGKISYDHNGNTPRVYENVGKGGKFSFKDKKLKSANFNVTKDSEYTFGNQKVKVPKDSHVIFDNNKVTIELPKDVAIEKPTKIPDSKEEDVKVEYRYKQGEEPSSVKIKDNGKEYDIKKIGTNKFQLNYDGKQDAFYVNGKFETNGLRVGEHSGDSEADSTYLFFDGKEHDSLKGSYISMGDKKVLIGASSGELGPTVQFLPGNGVVTVDDKKLVMMQAIGGEKGGHLTMESRDSEGKIPKVTATGAGYNMFFGEKAIRYSDGLKDKKGPILLKKNPLGDFATGKESIPMHVVTLDKTGNRLSDWDVVVDSYNGIKAGSAKELEEGGVSVRQGVVTSIRASFHSLTKDEQAKLGTLSPEKRRELVGKDANQIREELKKIPDKLKIEPDKPTDTKPGNTTITPPKNNSVTPGPVKIGDKMKDSDKTKYKNILKNTGVKYPTKYNVDGVYNQILTGDGKKLNGYILEGTFKISSNSWGTETVQKIAITNNEIYVWKKSSPTTSGTNYNWVKYKNIK